MDNWSFIFGLFIAIGMYYIFNSLKQQRQYPQQPHKLGPGGLAPPQYPQYPQRATKLGPGGLAPPQYPQQPHNLGTGGIQHRT